MNQIIISLIIGIAMFVIFFVVFSRNDEDIDTQIQKRLQKVKNKTFDRQDSKTQAMIAKNLQILFKDTEYRVKFLAKILDKTAMYEKVKHMLKEADMTISPDVFVLMSCALPCVFLLLSLLLRDFIVVFLAISIITFIFPFASLNFKRKKRLEMFTKQFPDALGLIASSLRAGHSLHSSFQTVVEEMPYPINLIFKTVVDDISLGRDTRDAMSNMLIGMSDSLDLRFFVTAVLIQREIGGNLAEILDGLSNTIRERFKLLGQLNAQTSMAKMSGTILAIAPVAIGLVLWFMNPQYMEPLFKETVGKLSLAGAIASAVVGYIFIMKITDIKV